MALRGGTLWPSYDKVIDTCDVQDWIAELEFEDRSNSWRLVVKAAKRNGGQRIAEAFGGEQAPAVFELLGQRLAKKLRL